MSDAFAGLKLSETARPSASVDQRLFASPAETKVTHWQERVGEKATAPRTEPPNSAPASQRLPVVHPDVAGGGGDAAQTQGEGKREKGQPELSLASARIESPLLDPGTRSMAPFDIDAKPWRKDSFLFTDSEFDRLDDLKLEIRRRFDLAATKNDIARAALQSLFEDYARNPEKSRVIHYLRMKKR